MFTIDSLQDPLALAYQRIPWETGNYPYVTARVRAKKAFLIPPAEYEKLLQMEISQIARYMGETQYKEEIVALGARFSGVALIEAATRDNVAKVFTQIIEFSEGGLRAAVGRYLDRWDVYNVKTILRGLFHKAAAREIADALVPAGSLPAEFLEQVATLTSVEEVAEALGDTLYGEVLLDHLEEEGGLASLAPFEDALTHAYYASLLASIPTGSEPMRLFHDFVRREIDVLNVKTLLRLRRHGLVPERDVFVVAGRELTKVKLDHLITAKPADFEAAMAKLSFSEAFAPHLKAMDKEGLGPVTRALEKFLLVQAARFGHLHPISVIPVIDYIVRKEREVENLRVIARGKADGLPTETIRDLLVV